MVGESENHEYRVRMNNDDGEIVIVADLPAVSAEDVAVHTNDESRTVEITVKGETVESIPMEWNEASITKMNFENQILEVHVQPKSDNRGNANSNVADK
jgi:HSP20 family molecular chaperone IbpA